MSTGTSAWSLHILALLMPHMHMATHIPGWLAQHGNAVFPVHTHMLHAVVLADRGRLRQTEYNDRGRARLR